MHLDQCANGTHSPLPGRGRKLLWVDDSRPLLGLYKLVFEGLGFQVRATSSPGEALDHLCSDDTDAAIVDYEMPEMNGDALASLIKGRRPNLPVILYSGSDRIPPNAMRWVDAICSKAESRQQLLITIEALSPRHRLRTVSTEHPMRTRPLPRKPQ